jgi:hypothetical protein
MSKEEIKQEINKALDQFSDKALNDLLSFLKGFQNQHAISLLSGENLKKVLAEDRDLLQRLAQ